MLDVGSISRNSKMPGTTYGLPAQECKIGSILAKAKGSTCSGCYALKGNYVFASVKEAQYKRLASITEPGWSDAMVAKLNAEHAKLAKKQSSGYGWHRWHDSGDLQSVNHLLAICDICRATPHIRHWLPTRELGMVIGAQNRLHAFNREFPDNLTIRVSATMVDGPPTKAFGLTSTVVTSEATCLAPKQGNACGSCRTCWSKDTPNVSYHKH